MNIAGLDKAAVFAALYNAARPQGLGFAHYDPQPIGVAEAQALMGRGDDIKAGFNVRLGRSSLSFDYVKGRVMKIDLSGDEVNTWAYNRDNGEGVAEKVVEILRRTENPKAPEILAIHGEGTLAGAAETLRHDSGLAPIIEPRIRGRN